MVSRYTLRFGGNGHDEECSDIRITAFGGESAGQ